MSFIFGEGTDLTYEDVQRKRKIADSLMAATMRGRSKNVGEGLSAIGKALMYRAMDKKATAGRDRLDSEASDLWGSVFGGGDTAGYGGSATPSAAPSPQTSPDGYALDMGSTAAPDRNTVAVGGTEYDMGAPDYWGDKRDVQQGIFAGESGGDYDALFGYQNRPGGVFDGMKPSEMQVADVLEFTNPRGAYGQYVKGQVGRVATPVGAYQIVGTTLRDAVKAGVVAPDERFSKDVQDRVGRWILDTQGTGAWEGYRGPGGAPSGAPSNGMNATVQTLMGLASNPVIMNNPARAKVVETLLGQALQRPDPMRDIEMETARLNLERLKNPQPEFTIEELADGRKYYVDPTGAQPSRLVNPDLELPNSDRLSKQQMAEANTLRDDFEKVYSSHGDILNGFANIHNALSQPGAVSDVQLAVSFTKVLDPGSVAREGEVMVVQQAAGLGEQLTSAINNALRGTGGLSPGQRQQIYRLSQQKYEQSASAVESEVERYAKMAARQGIPRSDVVKELQRLAPYEDEQLLEMVANRAWTEAASGKPTLEVDQMGNEIPRKTDTGATSAMTPEEAMKIADEVLQQQSQQPSRRDGRK